MIDGFLTERHFAFLRQALRRLEYRTVGSDYMSLGAAWTPEELRPLESRPFDSGIERNPADPVSVALALFIEAIDHASDLIRDVCALHAVGTYSLRSYLYPQSVTLNWHSDVGKGGAFTYYHHEKWHRRWGGELLVADATVGVGSDATGEGPDEAPPSEDDDGYVLRPLPNRLVILRSGVAHKIVPVSRAAGAHTRASLTGFIASDERAD